MTVPQAVIDDVIAHAREERPRECCGLLIGAAGKVSWSIRAANVVEGTRRFQIDPRDHLRAIRLARDQHLDVVGFYHSHPQTRAYPSETDVAESAYAHAIHLIVGFPAGAPELRAFRLAPGVVVEEPIVVCDRAGGTVGAGAG